jgi:hypothetical protein
MNSRTPEEIHEEFLIEVRARAGREKARKESMKTWKGVKKACQREAFYAVLAKLA